MVRVSRYWGMHHFDHTPTATVAAMAALRVGLGPGLQAGGVSDRTLRAIVEGIPAGAA